MAYQGAKILKTYPVLIKGKLYQPGEICPDIPEAEAKEREDVEPVYGAVQDPQNQSKFSKRIEVK